MKRVTPLAFALALFFAVCLAISDPADATPDAANSEHLELAADSRWITVSWIPVKQFYSSSHLRF